MAKDNSDVAGFAELNNKFYVVHKTGLIEVYAFPTEHGGKVLLEIERTIEPCGVHSICSCAPSKSNNRLYLGNHDRGSILYVDAAEHDQEGGQGIKGFIIFENDKEFPQSLSAISDGRVVVLVANENKFCRTWRGRIEVYSHNNAFLASVLLPEYVVNPWCVKYSGTIDSRCTFTVSYGFNDFGIITLDEEGRILAKCTDGLSMPRSLNHVEGTDCVYVLDGGTCLLLQFDKNLKKRRVLHNWNHGKDSEHENKVNKQPTRITVDSERTYMIVGMESGRANLYRMTDACRTPMRSTDDNRCRNITSCMAGWLSVRCCGSIRE